MGKKSLAIGIDIGGTNTVFGFVNKEGEIICEASITTCAEKDAEQLFERLFTEIDKFFAKYKNDFKLIGVGIGAPNANYYKGTIEAPPNLNWGIVNVFDIVKRYSSLPVILTNDANAAAIGEMTFGAAKGMKNFIEITLGTGLGSGIVLDGKLVYGQDGFAGEIGHTIMDPNGRKCGCGRKGCLETYASATGLKKTVVELAAINKYKSKLCNKSFEELTAKEIAIAAKEGDRLALDAFDFTAKMLGLRLADSVAYLNPEAIILFGGLVLAGELLLHPTKKYMEKYLLNIFKNKVKLLPSELLASNAAILGASALVWNQLKG